ncbi:protein TOPAZ1 [Podarcis raffonei]|uniref:protein TOPAZ1 n=1 Tax=Podarcis raffonei TaxID=65483 RepID=UPI002329869E|nr:protein TOPAZ1 [Podarcis raffonei]
MMVRKVQKNKEQPVCLLPEIEMEAERAQPSSSLDRSRKDESSCKEKSFSLSASNLSNPIVLGSEVQLGEKQQQSKEFVSKRRKGQSTRERNADCNYDVGIKLKGEMALVERCDSKKAVRSMADQPNDSSSRVCLQTKLASWVRKKRERSLLGMESHDKDTTPEKNSLSSLLEPERKIQSCLKNARSLRKKHSCSFLKPALCLMGKDRSSVTGLESQEVTRELQKSESCSELGPHQKTWNMRKKTKLVWQEQKAFRNPEKSQRTNRGCLSFKLKPDIQSVSPRTLGESEENSSVAGNLEKLHVGAEVPKQNSKCLSKCVANLEENGRYRNTAEKRKHKMVTRASLKSVVCENDDKNLSWTPEKSVSEVPGCRQVIFEEKMMDCGPTEDLLITRVHGSIKKQRDGKDEIVTSTELKKKTRTSREQVHELSSIQHGKVRKTGLSTSQDCNIQNLLEQSASLPVSKSDETESKDPVIPCFGADTSLFPVTNANSQLLDITVAENVETNALVVQQNEECKWFSRHNTLPYTVERTAIPVVRLLDCRYIKALLTPTDFETTQSCKLHSGSLHVALDQCKVLFSSGGMGQNDLSCSPNIVQAGQSFPEKSTLVEKEMCQNTKNSSRCQNRKRSRESKMCLDFKKLNKGVKVLEDLEKTDQEAFTSVNIHSECGLQMESKTAVRSSTILENPVYNETTLLSSLGHTPDFVLEQAVQKPQNKRAKLSCGAEMSKAHFITCSAIGFEKSEILEKENELSRIEPQICCSNKLVDNSIRETLVSQKITNHSNNVAGCMKREKRTVKENTIHKVRKKLELQSCQRAVPVSGKNVWPRESCARTYLWFGKNHASDSKREFLRVSDSVILSGQAELHKPLACTVKASAYKVMEHKTQLPNENPTSESVVDTCKAHSATANDSRSSSMGMEERPKHCRSSSTKNVKKSKRALNSSAKEAKNKGSIAKRNSSIDTHNGVCSDSGKHRKTSVLKQEPLIKGNLSNFKIPLLKDKNESRKTEYTRLSRRDVCSPLDILDSTVSVKKARAKETSSNVHSRHQFKSKEVNGITVLEENADQFDKVLESLYKETSVHNEGVETSHERELELADLKDNPDTLSTGYMEIQNHNPSPVLGVPNNDESNYSNNFAQDKANFSAEVVKAYEDDVLVIDVIQDDPDLFGETKEEDKGHCTQTNLNVSISIKEEMEVEPEPPQLPQKRHLDCCPREDPIQYDGTLESFTDVGVPLAEVDGSKSEFLCGISSTGGVAESCFEDGQLSESDDVLKSSNTNEKYKISTVKEEAEIQDTAKIERAQYIESMSHDHQLELTLPAMKTDPRQQVTAVKPWVHDFRFSGKGPLLQPSYPNSLKKNVMTYLGLSYLPRGVCRIHFNTLNGCQRANCRYSHSLAPKSEKLFTEILNTYISIGEEVLLQRAAQVFTDYCRNGVPEKHLDSQILNNLLTSLLQCCLLKELFLVFHTSIMIKILPTVDILLNVFEQVASMKLRVLVPELIDISCKLCDGGMVFKDEHIGCITSFLNQLQVSSQEQAIFLSRFQARHFHKASLCGLDSAIAEFQHCKEKGDWAKLGTLYVNVRSGCENFGDLEKYSLCIANILTDSVTEERPGVPFCEFAVAVKADACHNETDTTLLGRIGIGAMFSYYKLQQWPKAKKVLDTLHALKIHFTFLKGLLGQERLASRCHIVNIAVEIFLKCRSLNGALWVLRESEWIISTLTWPCDRMDVLKRHNLLYVIASECIAKSRYGEAFEVLQNLPGFRNSCNSLDVSQYRSLFNKLLGASLESQKLQISSTVVDFMLAKNIPVEFDLLRALITALGRGCWWLKARAHYKHALALGCYPPLEGNLHRKLLLIPSYMTEIEMLLAIEIFLVSNASSIQSPGASNQILQIVLKRCEGKDDNYQCAVERLIQATNISTPKLFIKHFTVNSGTEQVCGLENICALEWLKENMKWAGKVWLF